MPLHNSNYITRGFGLNILLFKIQLLLIRHTHYMVITELVAIILVILRIYIEVGNTLLYITNSQLVINSIY